MKRFLMVTSVCAFFMGATTVFPLAVSGASTRMVKGDGREVTLQAQRQLKALGFNPGAIDGNLGPQTEAAVREYQRAYRLPQTGKLDEATVRSLLPEQAQYSTR
jgi:peptidoglycan hydrolase-like protein with peptidoglycan-binding domain